MVLDNGYVGCNGFDVVKCNIFFIVAVVLILLCIVFVFSNVVWLLGCIISVLFLIMGFYDYNQ